MTEGFEELGRAMYEADEAPGGPSNFFPAASLFGLPVPPRRWLVPSLGLNYAPSTFAKHPEAEGCTKDALRLAMERLLVAGKVKVVHGGPPSRPVTWLERAR